MSALPADGHGAVEDSSITPTADDLRQAHMGLLRAVLDDAVPLGTLERLKLTRELAQIKKDLNAGVTTLQRVKLARRMAELRTVLMGAAPAPAPAPAPTPTPPADDMEAVAEGRQERTSTSRFYDFDPNRKPAQRKRENAAAMELLAQIDAGQVDPATLTDEQRTALAKYSGTGGNLVGADGKKGSAYEYYTPKPIAEGMWTLLAELGFKGGRVLDPSAGVGVFGGTAPVNAAVDAIELNATSGRVNQLVNDGPGYKTTIAPFEQVAAATPDEVYDAVITNVPFGGVEDRGGNQYKDTKYRNEPLQNYFILRSLEKLRPGGLAAFITPPRVVSGKGGKEEDLRRAVSYVAEFMGAYRLPNSVFGTAAADTITDVIVFRKFSRETLDKVAELREQNPALLTEANVVWPEFIEGRYFAGDGRRFILGEFVAKDPNKFRDVDRVINDGSMTDIARLLRKFPDSRIRWDLLDAAETSPIVYRDGDTMMHAGQTLQLQDGRWVVIKAAGDEEAAAETAELLAKCSTPLGVVNAGVLYGAARALGQALIDGGRALDVPDWLRVVLAQLERLDAGARESAWSCATVGLAIDQAMKERQSEETGFNYLEGYPQLSEAMARVWADAKSPPSMLGGATKAAIKKIGVYYSKAGGYSAVWRGDVVSEKEDSRDTAARFEAEKYAAGGGAFVSIDIARAIHGEAFDPIADNDWCLSGDGRSVARADDYYVGNYADFLARINAEIEAATDDVTRGKLMRQKANAEGRLLRADPSQMTFTLFSPFVTMEERAEFLRRFVDPRFMVAFDEKTGEPVIEIDIKTPKDARDKLLKRMALYLSGNRLTLGGADFADEKKAIEELRRMAQTAEAQFNAWVRANPVIMGRINDVANDPARIYFRQVEDDSPLTIPGLNPSWESKPYQNVWIRKMGREFAGINGDGVGLGKTSQGLIAAQHALNIGVNRKTMFVVPNNVLSNWRKEAGRVYASTDDCLYVGLRETGGGGFRTDTAQYDRDLTRILENRHRKIFVTYEAFGRLRLRESTVEKYDSYLASVDASYAASDQKKADEKGKSRRAQIIDLLTSAGSKSLAAPFFEDLGVDSLVIDEAHFLKNSREVVDFKGGKFLSLSEASARGLDAQAKAWFIRDGRPRRDGVVCLTATPITNSPLEIYSMLALSVGDAKLQDLMVGIKGADEFMEVMCTMENRDEETLDGQIKPYDVFTGLSNVTVLRNALAATTTMRTAEQVGEQIVVPDAEEAATAVALPEPVTDRLKLYKEAFRYAIDELSERKENRGSKKAYDEVAELFGEPMNLIGHPFNLINKMTMLIADPELDQRASMWVISPAQAAKAEDVVGKWNAKAPVEERPRMGPHTAPEAVVGKKTKKDGDNEVVLLRIQARAKVAGDRIVLDSMDPQTQASFEALAEKEGLELDVTVPPKLAAMVANYQHEEANPRGRVSGLPSGRVRQLVFCDLLAWHGKIKRLLVKRCGVAAAAIAILTGKVNGKPEEILAVQDGFNAEGEDNKYRCVIANEKAEVGINLQKGTQAIHHLTLGWTPDSLTQRNGRGVRQGNETQRVRVYHYDANGTFDVYKRMLVGKKSDWISAVVDPNGGNEVAVSGGLTREQLEALIDSVGDDNAMSKIQERAAAADRLAREQSTQGKQAVQLQTIKAQREFLAKYPKALDWAADKLAAYVTVKLQIGVINDRLANPKATASALLKNQNLLAELTARSKGLLRLLDESVTINEVSGYSSNRTIGARVTIDEFVAYYTRRLGRGEKAPDVAAERLKSPWQHEVTVLESGAIGNEWRSEVDQATAMIEESQRDFARLSKDMGGYSAEVLGRLDNDEASVIDGRIVCAGAFVDTADGLGVVVKASTGLVAQFLAGTGSKRVAVSDVLRGARIVMPGAEGYDALITKAAAIEDELAASGKVLKVEAIERLFSTVVPEVGKRRKGSILIGYSARGYGHYELPAPHFPVVLLDDVPEGAPLAALVQRQQAEVVKQRNAERGTFAVASDLPVERVDSGKMPWGRLLDMAKAAGLKITAKDFEAFNSGFYDTATRVLLNAGRAAFAGAVTEPATSPEDLLQRLRAWLEGEAFPQYDLGTDSDYNADPVAFLQTADFGAAMDYRRAKSRLEAAAAPKVGGDAPPANEAPAEPDVDPNRIVGIKGNTKAWKDQIKDMARRAGGSPIWDGDAGTWNVPYRAWTMLVASFPAAERELNVVESSGKTSYARSRRRY